MSTDVYAYQALRDAYAGRNEYGDRIYLSVEVRERVGPVTTTEHEDLTKYTELSFTYDQIEKGRRTVSSFGANFYGAARSIVAPAKGWTLAELAIMADIAEEWHLNGMSAACAHMTPTAPRPYPASYYDDNKHLTCPETGYRFGTAWLVRVAPTRVLGIVSEFIRRHETHQVRGLQ